MTSHFDFLALPPALRDVVFEFCWVDKEANFTQFCSDGSKRDHNTACEDECCLLYRTRTPYFPMRQVNRQIKAEYDRHAAFAQWELIVYVREHIYHLVIKILTVFKDGLHVTLETDLTLSPPIKRTTKLELNILFTAQTTSADIEYHSSWIPVFVNQLDNLVGLRINCHLLVRKEEDEQIQQLAALLDSPCLDHRRLTKVAVFCFPERTRTSTAKAFEHFVGEWIPTDGFTVFAEELGRVTELAGGMSDRRVCEEIDW
jgi:hypothetical protein